MVDFRCGAASRRIDLAHVRRPIGGGPHEILRLTARRLWIGSENVAGPWPIASGNLRDCELEHGH
jgi:hypothetical protein